MTAILMGRPPSSVPPRALSAIVREAAPSTIDVQCTVAMSTGSPQSGFALDLAGVSISSGVPSGADPTIIQLTTSRAITVDDPAFALSYTHGSWFDTSSPAEPLVDFAALDVTNDTTSSDIPADPTSTSATAHNGNVDIVFTPGVGGGTVIDYEVQWTLSAITEWTAGNTGAGSPVNVDGLVNGVSYDFRIRARGATSNSNWVTTGLSSITPSVFADLHRIFASDTSSRIFNGKRLDSLFQDSAGSTPVTTDGQRIERITDLSDNADFWSNASSPATVPVWRELDGPEWTGGTNRYLAFNTALTVSGNLAIGWINTQESGATPVWLTDTANHMLKCAVTTNPTFTFRSGNTNFTTTLSGFTHNQGAGYAIFWLAQRIAASSTVNIYAAKIGTNYASPAQTAFTLVGSIASVTGNIEIDELGNGTSGGDSPTGHFGFLAIRDSLFDNSTKRADLYSAMLEWLRA